MNMNHLNYGSLEACQRLVDAGIVVETEEHFDIPYFIDSTEFAVVPREGTDAAPKPMKIEKIMQIPRPSMAEAWRELPSTYQGWHLNLNKEGENTIVGYLLCISFSNTNPTDSLIYLKIWLTEQKRSTDWR